jgi:hypothetical protein
MGIAQLCRIETRRFLYAISTAAKSVAFINTLLLAVGRRMRCIQCMEFIRCQYK